MNLLLDFESRSHVDIRKAGAYNYACDPSTEILCCAVKVDDQPSRIWFPKLAAIAFDYPPLDIIDDEEFKTSVEEADSLHAWNAQFERLMWREIMVKRHGFPEQPISRWRCTAAQAAALALPRSLGECGKAMSLPIQKDAEGHKLMLRMCKPQKQPKRGPALPEYIEDEASLIRLGQYCITDAGAERIAHTTLRALPASEQRIWELDQEINDRGIGIDIPGCRKLHAKVQIAKEALDKEIAELTNGYIETAGQRDAILDWLAKEGVEMEDLKKGTVVDVLTKLPEGDAKRLLELRQSGALASVAKLPAMLTRASADGRARGAKLYHGASTGRWAGQGIQGDNLPRDSYKTAEEVDFEIEAPVDKDTIKKASKCIRGMIVPEKGKQLSEQDYSGIEARTLAWVAREESDLEIFRSNLDPYISFATILFGVEYGEVTKEQRQMSKVPVLACGYQAWIGGFRKFEETYGVSFGDDDKVKDVILTWREAHPKTRELWAGLEEAALETVRTGKGHRYDRVAFGIKDNFLYMRLPSGRNLAYPYPEIRQRITYYKDGKTMTPSQIIGFGKLAPYELPEDVRRQVKDCVTFMGLNTYSRKWERLSTYGGKWAENLASGLARDVLCDGMLTLDALGVEITNHVHDAIGWESVTDFGHSVSKILCQPPPWAPDLPLAAEG